MMKAATASISMKVVAEGTKQKMKEAAAARVSRGLAVAVAEITEMMEAAAVETRRSMKLPLPIGRVMKILKAAAARI